jgi:two-component system, NarL family, response regulator NreC
MSKTNKIRVLIADDHAILRTGLRMLIDSQQDMCVVAEAQDGIEATEKVKQVHPDVAILDLTMPRSGGLDAIQNIVRADPAPHVLLLTMHEDPAYLRTALAAGAAGYVLKKSVDGDLLSAVRAVYRGRRYVDSELADVLVQDAFGDKRKAKTAERRHVLSERELQVLKLVAEGFSSREIADQISISTKTVEAYRARFATKLGLKSRAQIVQYALNLGFLSPEKFTALRRVRLRSES